MTHGSSGDEPRLTKRPSSHARVRRSAHVVVARFFEPERNNLYLTAQCVPSAHRNPDRVPRAVMQSRFGRRC